VWLGPLFNPAIAFGGMVFSPDFSFVIQYVGMPFAGAAIALVFYEFVFVKSQEFLNEGASSEGSNKELGLPDGLDIDTPPNEKKIKKDQENKLSDEDENN